MEKLIKRWKATTPKFWKKVIYLGVTIGGVGTGLLVIEGLPLFIYELSKGMATVGAVSAVLAKLTTEHPVE